MTNKEKAKVESDHVFTANSMWGILTIYKTKIVAQRYIPPGEYPIDSIVSVSKPDKITIEIKVKGLESPIVMKMLPGQAIKSFKILTDLVG